MADAAIAAEARTARRNAEADLVVLLLSALVVLLSTLLTPDPQTLRLFGWTIPPLCLWSNLTGWECFGCGLTRSFTYMGHLDPLNAFRLHKLGPLLWLLVLAQLPWRLRNLLRYRREVLARPIRG